LRILFYLRSRKKSYLELSLSDFGVFLKTSESAPTAMWAVSAMAVDMAASGDVSGGIGYGVCDAVGLRNSLRLVCGC